MSNEGRALAEQHGGTWGQHPVHSVKDWANEVYEDETRLGYWDWVLVKIALFANDFEKLEKLLKQ